MAQLDISQAAFSGFGVIRRTGLAPAVWGVVQTVLAVLPMLLVLPAMIELFTVIAQAGAGGTEPDQAEMMRLSNQMNVVQPLSWICQLAAQGLVTGAIFRAVMHPEDKRWFYMRLGMAEVMLVAVSLVFTIIWVIAMVVAGIAVAIVALIVGAIGQTEAGIAVAVLLGLVAFGVLIWASLRFSLGFAMSHDKKQFLLFESWKMTKGHAGGLFGVALISVLIGWLISLAVVLVLFAIGAGIVVGTGGLEVLGNIKDPKDLGAFFTPERTPLLIAFGVLYLLVATAINGYIGTIFTAPWAETYRQLGHPSAEVF